MGLSPNAIECEIPTFLNLLKVTSESGLDLSQSLKCLEQSAETSCPRLVKTFSSILEESKSTNTEFTDALLKASELKANAPVKMLMQSLAAQNSSHSELMVGLHNQMVLSNAVRERACHDLERNFLRRWVPQFIFLVWFALPVALFVILGPAIATIRTVEYF